MKNNVYHINKISPFSAEYKIENDGGQLKPNIDFYSLFLRNKTFKIKQISTNSNNIKKDIENFDNVIQEVYNKINDDTKNLISLLIFGYIQSGKTDFIIGLIIKLLTYSEQQKLIIVLTSNDVDLSKQTFNRFENQVKPMGMTNQISILNFKSLKESEFVSNSCVVFLCKNKIHLENLNNFINKNSYVFREIVIFDDEGDQASFNDYRKENIDEKNPINDEIRQILDHKNDTKISYISITASPFAHIIADENNALKPDYAYILKPGCNYIGIKEYINEMQKRDSKIINIIKVDEDAKHESFDKLDVAFCDYLIQCLIFMTNPHIFDFRKPRMLVNVFRKKLMHYEIKKEIENCISSFTRDLLVFEFEKLFNYSKNNKFLQNNNFNSWKDAYHFIKVNILPLIEILIINGDYKKENKNLNLDGKEENKFQIVIGSDKLGRGITIQDLTTTYIKRRSEQNALMDTILQQARWLGYRKEYFEISKIYITKSLINDYFDISQSIEDLEIAITNCNKNNLSFKAIERFVRTSSTNNIKPTRNTIAEVEWINNNGLFYLMNNVLKSSKENSNNSINRHNEQFFLKFIESNKIQAMNSYPIIFFDNIDEFNHYFFDDLTVFSHENIISRYEILFSINRDSKDILEKILNMKNKKVCVRYIFDLEKNIDISLKDYQVANYPYKERKLVNNLNFGNGNYAYENEIYFTDEYITIDILPLKIWGENVENKNIFRTKLFIPKSLAINKVGYKGR